MTDYDEDDVEDDQEPSDEKDHDRLNYSNSGTDSDGGDVQIERVEPPKLPAVLLTTSPPSLSPLGVSGISHQSDSSSSSSHSAHAKEIHMLAAGASQRLNSNISSISKSPFSVGSKSPLSPVAHAVIADGSPATQRGSPASSTASPTTAPPRALPEPEVVEKPKSPLRQVPVATYSTARPTASQPAPAGASVSSQAPTVSSVDGPALPTAIVQEEPAQQPTFRISQERTRDEIAVTSAPTAKLPMDTVNVLPRSAAVTESNSRIEADPLVAPRPKESFAAPSTVAVASVAVAPTAGEHVSSSPFGLPLKLTADLPSSVQDIEFHGVAEGLPLPSLSQPRPLSHGSKAFNDSAVKYTTTELVAFPEMKFPAEHNIHSVAADLTPATVTIPKLATESQVEPHCGNVEQELLQLLMLVMLDTKLGKGAAAERETKRPIDQVEHCVVPIPAPFAGPSIPVSSLAPKHEIKTSNTYDPNYSIFSIPGKLQMLTWDNLSKYVLRHYQHGATQLSSATAKTVFSSTSACKQILVDLINAFALIQSKLFQISNRIYLVEYIGPQTLLVLFQTVCNCLPMELAPSHSITGLDIEVLTNALFNNYKYLNNKEVSCIYRVEFWVQQMHLSEVILCLSRAIHELEYLSGMNFGCAFGPKDSKIKDEAFISNDYSLVQVYASPDSTALFPPRAWREPSPQRQLSSEVSTARPAPLASPREPFPVKPHFQERLVKEIQSLYARRYKKEVPETSVVKSLKATLSEIFNDEMIINMLVNETVKKIRDTG